ncbi:MAG: STAS domain-containing protein [Proteobacteria bacterium]|nr:STAS domain-containing protein [Pseudomonadota bacterium]
MARELYLKDEMIDGVLVIHVGGHIDGVNAQEFQRGLNQRIQNADGPAVLDFKSLTYISSAGLRSILLAAKVFRDKNKKFVLCSLPETALQVIRISGFDKIIEIQESQSMAIAATTN